MRQVIKLCLSAALALTVFPALTHADTCVPPPANMVLWLPFDEVHVFGSGMATTNLQAGNTGGLIKGIGTAFPVIGAGEVSAACQFNGANLVNVNTYAALDVPAIAANGQGGFDGEFTLDAWIKAEAGGGATERIVYKLLKTVGPAKQTGYSLFLQQSGNAYRLALELGDGAATTSVTLGPAYPNDNQWHHVAVGVCGLTGANNSVFRVANFYIDGTPAVANPYPLLKFGSLASPAPFRVGQGTLTATDGFVGSIDEVEVFNRCLTDAEIQSIAGAKTAGKCKESLGLCWDQYFTAQSPDQRTIPFTITNSTAITQTYTYVFSSLPAHTVNNAPDPGPTSFTPNNMTVSVPAMTTMTFSTVMDRPVAWVLGDWGDIDLAVTNIVSHNTIHHTANAWDVRQAQPQWVNHDGMDNSCPALDTSGKTALSDVYLANKSATPAFNTLIIAIMTPEGVLDTKNVSLNGQAPGTSLALDVFVDAGQTIPFPPLTVEFLHADPNRPYTILIETDLLGDGNLETVFSGMLTNVIPATDATLLGRIALEGVNDLSAINPNVPLPTVTVECRTPGTTTVVQTTNVPLIPVGANNPFGTYSLAEVTAGTYDITFKTKNSLRVLLPNITIDGAVTLPDVTLPGGDAMNDNSVDIADFGVLVNAYDGDISVVGSGYDSAADFNYDGVVDIADFGILVNEYGEVGAP